MVQGRIVWTSGDLFKGKPKIDQNTKQPRVGRNGEPLTEYGFGLAVPKSALAMTGKDQPGEIWAAIHEEAFTLYPSRQLPPSFAMKYKDGDGIDDKGQPFANREGYAGHLVFACTTSIPIKFFRHENGQNIIVNEGIKCGDYVQVQLQIKAHPAEGTAKAGLYLNPNAVLFLGYGTPIINAPSGDQIFGTAAPTLPPGASATPIAPSNNLLVPSAQPAYAPPVGGQPAYNPSMPQPSVAAPAIQPYYGVLPQAHQPQTPPMGNGYAPAAPASPQYGQAAPVPTPGYAQPAYPSSPAPAGMPQAPQYAPQGAPVGVPAMPPFPGQR